MFMLIVIVNIVSVVANWDGDLRVGAIIALVASIWALGIASNFRQDPMSMPNYAPALSMLAGIAGLVLAIVGFTQ